MNDQLENFIHQNRNNFDDKEPNEKVWKKISTQLFSTPYSVWSSVAVWRAAAIILFGLCIYLIIPKVVDRNENTMVLNEFKDIESFYVSQISDKVSQLSQHTGEQGSLNGFTHDFQQLEAMYYVLKEEMKLHPGEKVKDALVLNLLIRIDLLNQQLHKLEKHAQEIEPVKDTKESDTKIS